MIIPKGRKFFVYKAVFSTGERFPVVLHTDSLQPAVLATRYIIDERRETRQASTLEREVRVLCWLYEWCSFVGVHLETRLRSGESLSSKQIQGFSRWVRSGRQDKLVGTIGKVNAASGSMAVVLQPRTFNSYLSTIESFLVWAADEFIPKTDSSDDIRRSLRGVKRKIRRSFKAFKAVESVERARRYGLTDGELDELRKLTMPRGKLNPFRKQIQNRNHLIFETMLATGVRAGELLKIRLQDLPRGPKQTVSIVRQPDDAKDPRKDEPRVKTRSREIPIPRKLATELVKYVQQDRGQCDHPYLFVSSRGKVPLSRAGLSKFFLALQRHFQVSERRIHPHLLRHTFNDLLMDRAKQVGMSDDVRVKVQNFLCGWVEGSSQSEVYTRRFVEAEAWQLIGKYQEALW
ncbi:putative Integrase family protein [Pseudodesulfovibrio profundus]|uniref:Putative Integrase family protein n=1 Tax=Pseudodesulfovibrio profundus TaxID=57320 RepID=A0A2C8F739_9BACT|nr:site-specific integrase [Pseudodesulfovibrio profundus]SOB57940.1 putative Integrase family protein [Pseudodesulfovibrio profundus]